MSTSTRLPSQRTRNGSIWPIIKKTFWKIVLYAILFGLAALVILPLGWMLTVALKPDNTPVFTLPPEFFPTKYFHWRQFCHSADQPQTAFFALHLEHIDHLCRECHRFGAVLHHGGICFLAPALQGQKPLIQYLDHYHAHSRGSVDDPYFYHVLQAWLVRHLSPSDCAIVLRVGLLYFPHSPVYGYPAPRTGSSRPHRRM